MRRSLANLLLIVLIGSFALPLLQAKPHIAACCLRGGQHHCAAPLPGDGFHSSPSNCPYRHAAALLPQVVTSFPSSSPTLLPDLRWGDSLYFESEHVVHRVGSGTSERGPPLA